MKLALLAKEGIRSEILFNGPTPMVTYPSEPVYEEPVGNHTQVTERDRKIRNQQPKVSWQSRFKKIDEIGILCGIKPWEYCEQEASSLLYLCIRTEGRRIFESKHLYFIIENESLKKFSRLMEVSFTKTRNKTYDHLVFLSFKQQKGESVEIIYGQLI